MSTTSRQFYTAERIFKSGFVNLFRNAWLTIAATAIMVVALTIISLAVVLNVTANNAITVLARDLKASIYLQEEVNDGQLTNLRKAVEKLDFVDNVEYISKEQAKKDFAGDFNNDQGIIQAIDLVGENALQSSLKITVNDLKRMPEIKTLAENEQFSTTVESVSLGQKDAQETIDRAASAQRFINTASILSAVVLSVVSVLIIFNTIRMAIYTRRDEIRIMKLIGATPGYIRGPFIVEASLYGVFAGIIANTMVYSMIFSLGKKLASQPEFSQTYAFFTEPGVMFVMCVSVLLLGVLIGSFSSMLAMERHLKLKHW